MTGRRPPAPGSRPPGFVRALATLAVALPLSLTGLSTAGPASAAVSATEPGALPVTVSLTGVDPVALTPRSVLTVTGTLRNTGRQTLTGIRVNLRLAWQPITDRRELSGWAALAPLDERVGTLWERLLLPGPLPPGGTLPFVVSGRGDAVGLPASADAFGPRGMSVEVQDEVAGVLHRVGIVRTFTVWNPLPRNTPTRLSMLVPITSGTSPIDAFRTDPSLAAQWRPTGRLSRLLAASADPAFSYALDPALLVAGRAAQLPAAEPSPATSGSGSTTQPASGSRGAGPADGKGTAGAATATGAAAAPGSPTGTASGGSGFDPQLAADAAAWTAQLVASRAGRDLLTLPYGDPDVAALASGGYGDLLDLADRTAAAVTGPAFGAPLPDGLVWPVTGRTDPTAAGLAARPPGRTLVLSTAGLPIAPPGGSAQAHVRLSVPGGDADAILTDDALSTALAGTGGPASALATQRLLAETAAITAAHPGRPGTVLATVPRTWNPDPAAVTAAVTALRGADWVQLSGLAAVRDQAPVTVPRSRIARAVEAGAARELPAVNVAAVARQLRRVQSFAPALAPENPADSVAAAHAAAVIDPLRRQGLQLLSVAWIGSPPGPLAAARTALDAPVAQLYAGISVVAGSSMNLITSSGPLPVTVVNKLKVPVRVVLSLHPASARIQVADPVVVPLDAGRSSTVHVRIRAVANGDVPIEPVLSAPGAGGAQLSVAPKIQVHIRRDWEGRGLFWIGVALVVLLFAGLVRSARRPRVRISPDTVPDPDDVGRDRPMPGGQVVDARSEALEAGPDPGRATTGRITPTDRAGQAPDPTGTRPAGSLALAARPALPGVVVERLDHGTGGRPPGPELEHLVVGIGGELSAGPASTSSASTSSASGGSPDPAEGADGGGGDGGGTSRLLSSSAIMAAGTLASRVLGVLRVVVLAWAIGQQGLSADIFATANTLPNSLMILLAGGVLNAVLVPQIVRAAQHSDGGRDYLDRLLTLAIAVLGAATVVSIALAPVLVRVFGSERWTPAQLGLGTAFALWCLPQIFFYGLYTIYGQVLNARGSFGPYMWAPVVNNVVAIAGTLVFVAVSGPGRKAPEWWSAGPVALLAGTATLGIVAQALVLVPAMRRSGYTWRPTWGFRGIGLRTAGRVAGWTLAAAAVGTIGFAFVSQAANTGGARGAAAGGEAAGSNIYNNAYLLFILPHSLVAVSVVTAVFTRMSISASAGRTDEVRSDASLAVRLTGVATVLATVAFVVLSRDLTQAIFFGSGRGDTDSLALVTATMILGVVPFSAQYLFSRIFYAYQDARTPFLIQLVVVSVWAAGSLLSAAVLAPSWVVPGIGLAMSLSNLVGAGLSIAVLRRRIGGVDGARVLRTYVRLAVAALFAGVVAWFVSAGVHGAAGTGRGAAYLALLIGGSAMVVSYLAGLKAMKVQELDLVLTPVLGRLRRHRR